MVCPLLAVLGGINVGGGLCAKLLLWFELTPPIFCATSTTGATKVKPSSLPTRPMYVDPFISHPSFDVCIRQSIPSKFQCRIYFTPTYHYRKVCSSFQTIQIASKGKPVNKQTIPILPSREMHIFLSILCSVVVNHLNRHTCWVPYCRLSYKKDCERWCNRSFCQL